MIAGVSKHDPAARMNGETQPLKILIVSSVFAPVVGGAGAVPEALASCLPENISVLTERSGPAASLSDLAGFDQRFPFPVYRLHSLYTRISSNLPRKFRGALQFSYNFLCIRPRVILEVFRILREQQIQVVCVNTVNVGYWMPRLFKLLRPATKVIFYLHGEELSDGQARTRQGRLILASLTDADAIIAVSSYTAQIAAAQGVSAEKLCVLNNGVDVARFSPGPKDPAIQSWFGLHNERVLLCLARLDQRKGQDKLIQAMPEILAAVPNTVLLLVGSGEDEGRLRRMVEDLQLQSAVRFAGPASEEQVVGYYRTADVYVMPNRTTADGDTEGFGLVFLEAGACAKPVVGGRAGGVPDAILDGQTGFLVDGLSTQSIVAACVRLLADPALATEMGRAGLDHARRHSWTNQSARFLGLCEAVVHGHDRSRPGR